MITQTEENYIKALFVLSNDGKNEVNVNELSIHLKIKMPTVTNMMKKLHQKGFVDYESYKPLKITTKCRFQAGLIIRKHRLTEMFLVDKMGFGWEEVHDIAEQIEHIQAPKFFDKMDELLAYPTLDPHGSPIPNKLGLIQYPDYHTLADCHKGDYVSLVAVMNTTQEFLIYLNNKNLKLNTTIELLDKEDFDQSIHIRYDDHELTISKMVSEKLLVDKIK